MVSRTRTRGQKVAREMTNPFPTSVTPEQLWALRPKPDPPKNGMRRFWFICVPLGFLIGLVASVVADADIWFPCGCVASFVLWAVGKEE
jgi:hypothetical protein